VPLPPDLEQFQPIITRALKKDPNERYQSALEMKLELQSLLSNAGSFLVLEELPTFKAIKRIALTSEVEIGPYTLIKQLGKGAFGVVWLAEKRTAITTTKVALKLPIDEDPDLDEIKREADLWAHIGGHPNVLPIIEANIYNGQVVIASEYAPDGSLDSWMKKHDHRAPTIEAAVAMAMGILSGLEHLHSKKILHRDLKPANILLQGEAPRLTDFGLARILKTGSHSGGIAGTPAYMAPEAFDEQRFIETDIWAVGIILYQLLSGKNPFSVKNLDQLINAIVKQDPEPLPATLPLSLRQVVIKALQKNPQDRYHSASEMKAALQAADISKNSEVDAIESARNLSLPELSLAPTLAIKPANLTNAGALKQTQAVNKDSPIQRGTIYPEQPALRPPVNSVATKPDFDAKELFINSDERVKVLSLFLASTIFSWIIAGKLFFSYADFKWDFKIIIPFLITGSVQSYFLRSRVKPPYWILTAFLTGFVAMVADFKHTGNPIVIFRNLMLIFSAMQFFNLLTKVKLKWHWIWLISITIAALISSKFIPIFHTLLRPVSTDILTIAFVCASTITTIAQTICLGLFEVEQQQDNYSLHYVSGFLMSIVTLGIIAVLS
jgi:serine/threonine protein kinase